MQHVSTERTHTPKQVLVVRTWRSRVLATRGCHPQQRSLPRATPLPNGGIVGAVWAGAVQSSNPEADKVSSALSPLAATPMVWVRSFESSVK